MKLYIKAYCFRPVLFLIFITAGFGGPGNAFAQQRVNTDSLRLARQHILDSTRAEQQRKLDSARLSRQRITDSLKTERKRVADSFAAVRKYRESKHYKDSVASMRQNRLDSIKESRQKVFDSIRAERKRVTDSMVAARKKTTDSLRLIQKKRSDSLSAIRKYRESKRYKDSVALVRQIRLDSLRDARKAYNDSMVAARKKSLDSAAAVRKQYNDSVTASRKKFTDSLKAVRQVRADSLAKIRADREKLKKSQEKKSEEKMKLALELKIKKKREAWSNEKMLKKNWAFPRKFLQNTYTHYNYYFNTDKKMDEALENMQRINKEDYDSLLALFPFNPDRDSARLSADMDSIIQKASVGIQIHDPRTKWADDLYLLLGQAYYYKGNYSEAETAFRYIIAMNQRRKLEEQKKAAAKKKPVSKEVSVVSPDKKSALDFLKHKSVNNEAVLWLARTYTQANKENEAESILDLIESDKNLPDEIRGRLALEKAYLNLGRGNMNAASDNLRIVAEDQAMPTWVRTRAAYLNGQLLAQKGDHEAATRQFRMVVDFQPKIEMDFYARKNLAYSLIALGGNTEEAGEALSKMLKDGKYQPYYEQIYFTLGNLSAETNDPEKAIEYLQKSIESLKSTRKQKALSFASLGNVYYETGAYKNAKSAFDSALVYGRSMDAEPLIASAVKKGSVLGDVVTPLEIIHRQDSLLALAALSEKEQSSIVRRYLRTLQKQRDDSLFRSEGGDRSAAPAAASSNAEPGNNWYFASTALVQQGYNDFKRKWGNRPNVDNWRRISGMAAAQNNTASNRGAATDLSEEAETEDGDIPTEESLLAAIPNSEADRKKAREAIQKSYLSLADAYINKLDDLTRGKQALDTLERRFPDHPERAEVFYRRYQIALKQNRLHEAQALSEQLRNEFSQSRWAKDLAPAEHTEGLLASNIPVANYYDITYQMLQERQYNAVLERARSGQSQYQDSLYRNRFKIMEAIALAGSGKYEKADSLVTEFINTNPKDSLRSWADAVLNYIKSSKPVVPPKTENDSTSKGNILSSVTPPATSLPGEDNKNAAVAVPAVYTYKPSEEHYFIFYFKKMESKAMGIKAALNDFNTFNYGNQKLESSLDMMREDQGIIVVKPFPSASHAKIYINALKANKQMFKEYRPEEYSLLIISADNFKKLQADKNIIPYLNFYKSKYR